MKEHLLFTAALDKIGIPYEFEKLEGAHEVSVLQRGAEASHSKVRGKIKEKGNKGGARGARRFFMPAALEKGRRIAL